MLTIAACANIVAPSGGPVDQQPPRFLKSEPMPSTAHFTGKKLTLQFDEFVNLNDPFSKVTISPPVETFPEFRTKGKSIIVEFAEDLKPGVTYNIDFGDCIQDITENNPFNNYRFVFSTGDQIDSLIIVGMAINAFTQQPEKDVRLLLYRNPSDSLPYKVIPDFVAKSRLDGSFAFTSLPSGAYQLFALRDNNNNLKYDPQQEFIGFIDSLLIPQIMPQQDTLVRDSLPKDSLKPAVLKQHVLQMFQETDPAQGLLKASTDQIGQFRMCFKWPVEELTYRFLKNPPTGNWHLDEYSRNRDTLTCWVLDPKKDSLFLEISDQGKVIDTLELKLMRLADTSAVIPKKSGKGGDGGIKQFKLTMTMNAGGSTPLDLNVPLRIHLSHPLAESDLNRIQLLEMIDSTGFPVPAQIVFTDPGINRNLLIGKSWQRKQVYRLIIPKGTFKDIYGLLNDSLTLNFTTREFEEYGVLKMNLKIDSTLTGTSGEATTGAYLLQLMNDKDVVLKEKTISSKENLVFDYMQEGTYRARLIFDANNNGKWDTGNYLQKKQPEHIVYYPGTMRVKKNWDTEIDWIIK